MRVQIPEWHIRRPIDRHRNSNRWVNRRIRDLPHATSHMTLWPFYHKNVYTQGIKIKYLFVEQDNFKIFRISTLFQHCTNICITKDFFSVDRLRVRFAGELQPCATISGKCRFKRRFDWHAERGRKESGKGGAVRHHSHGHDGHKSESGRASWATESGEQQQ